MVHKSSTEYAAKTREQDEGYPHSFSGKGPVEWELVAASATAIRGSDISSFELATDEDEAATEE